MNLFVSPRAIHIRCLGLRQTRCKLWATFGLLKAHPSALEFFWVKLALPLIASWFSWKLIQAGNGNYRYGITSGNLITCKYIIIYTYSINTCIYIYISYINICYLSERYSNWFFSIFHGSMILEIASMNKQTHLSYHSGSRIAYPKPRSQAQIGQMLSSPSLVFKKLVQAQAHRSKILKTSTALQVSSFLLFMFIERSKWYCSNGCLCLTLPARHWHWRLAFCLRFLTGEVQRQQLMEIHTIEFVYSHRMNLK